MEKVIVVDERDNEIGGMDKMQAHKDGILHRAFSVLIYNNEGFMLMQQRAAVKYHSPLLWTNACCSHPQPGEDVIMAAQRRLKEEMGINCQLNKLGHFIYNHSFDNGLTEHEFDYVLKGISNERPVINIKEVNDWKWIKPELIKVHITLFPDKFTFWFKEIIDKFC